MKTGLRARIDRLSIRERIAAFALAILLPLAAMFALLLAQDLRRARDAAHARVDLVAAVAAQDIEQYLLNTEAMMRGLAGRPLVRALDAAHCDPLLADAVLLNPEFVVYAVRDRAGQAVCSYQEGPTPAAQLRRYAWFSQAQQGAGFFASDAFQRPPSSRWLTVLVQPVRDDRHVPIGFITLPLDLERLGERLLAVTPPGATVTVFDRDGVVLMRSHGAAATIGARGAVPPADAPVSLVTGPDGVRRLGVTRPVGGFGWRVLAALPEAEVYADYRAIAWRAGIVGLVAVLLATALTLRLGRAIAAPIDELARTAASVASGSVAARMRVAGPAEVTVVAREFNQMLDARDLADARLRESEARTRRLLALLPHAVFVSSDNRITFVNQAAQRLFDVDEARLLGRSPLDLVHPDSVERLRSRLAALHAGTAAAPAEEIRIRRSDGSQRVVEAVATRFEDRGAAAMLVVLSDITELERAQLALRESHADLQRLVEAQDKVLENERRRVARELHDDLQQTLAAIRLDLGAAAERLRGDAPGAASMLAEVDELAAAAIASTRRIVNNLRPGILEDLGLAPALEALAAQFQQRTGIATHVDTDPQASDAALASGATTTCLYRVAQEALNNVAKHAQAQVAELQLEIGGDGRLNLRITDDGHGFAPDDWRKPDSFGLLGMHERVRALGGTLRIHSRPGLGTTVEVELPMPAATASA